MTIFTSFPLLTMLLLAFSSPALAETIDASGYMPSSTSWEASPVWYYDSGTYMSQVSKTFAGQTAHAVYSSHDNAYFYWQIKPDGLYLLGAYYPNIGSSSAGGTTTLTATYYGANNIPGLLVIPTTVTTGTAISQAGEISYQWGNGTTATLKYYSSATFSGFETKTILFRGKDTAFKALKRQESLLISGSLGGASYNTVADSISYYALDIGKIDTTITTTVQGVVSSFAETMTDTNLIPSASETGSLAVTSGWNLLGNGGNQTIPVNAMNFPSSQFASLWQWDAAALQWQFYSPAMSAEELASFTTTKDFAPLSTIGPGAGFWVNAVTASALPMPVSIPISAMWLVNKFNNSTFPAGWNLLGLGQALTPAELFSAFATNPPDLGQDSGDPQPGSGNSSLWAWDNLTGKWRFYAPAMAADGSLDSYIVSKGFEPFTVTTTDAQTGLPSTAPVKLGNGSGFWLWFNQ